MTPTLAPGLEVRPDPEYARRAAAVGAWARGALAVAVGLALLGVFGGGGPLTRTTVAGEGGFAVRYDRFARLDAPVAVEVRLPRGASAMTFEADFADGLQVEAVSPAARAEAAVAGGVRYAFDAAPGAAVTVHARPLRFGVLRGAVALDGGERLAVRAVVYP
ncbi:hypothetical protein [Rubrivirga marina]|uniref:Uncharacterized protein n=1 Tax=Rubrivirga marina TaxID=1196024 RepID=A0A271IYW9_9BACT|nr:hypothetical protein [Rubrivirga marina]PAP76277.1 hypothetical protein BSZ37_07370 [Rubrivirga marina]